jgi:peptidoglycan hydrolase-like protein with peptidoglycan-binding domain
MSADSAVIFEETLRTLLSDQRTQGAAVEALDEAARSRGGERARIVALAALNAAAIRRCIERIEEGGSYRYEQLQSDSARAHRKAAAIQDVLAYLGFYLGPARARSRGYYGGPPGKPVAVPLNQAVRLLPKRPRNGKVLTDPRGSRESWTRDAVRRLQIVLGDEFAGTALAKRGSCLTRPDGLFGTITLNALKEFVARAGP